MNENERVNEIEASTILEDAQEQIFEALNQLTDAQREIIMIIHSIKSAAFKAEDAISKLMSGGDALD